MAYIIYTAEGETKTPNGDDIENCQILDMDIIADSPKEAVKKMIDNNPQILSDGYDHVNVVKVGEVTPYYLTDFLQRIVIIKEGQVIIHKICPDLLKEYDDDLLTYVQEQFGSNCTWDICNGEVIYN